MRIKRYTDPAEFLTRAQPYMEEEEVRNNLILGVTVRLHEKPEWIDTPPYLATVEDAASNLILVAAMTPPHNVLLAGAPDAPEGAHQLLIDDLRAGGWNVPGVTAESVLAGNFAAAWRAATGQRTESQMRMRAYVLHQVIFPPRPPAGCLRKATMQDFELMRQWRAAFNVESLHEAPPENLGEQVARQIESGTVVIWDDNGPVSTANTGRATRHGISIGAVYTPPELRGRGYASACVAAASQQILDTGKSFCTLFTDLDYPTSNSIYQKIGYQPVCDFAVLGFA